MSTHPYIPLYIDDFEAATAHLTPEEDGIYNRLLRLCWRTPGCSLPNDHAWIARKIRMAADDFQRAGEPVLAEFFTLIRGRLTQRRLKTEYDDISRKKSARVEAGKKGGTAKAQKTKGKIPDKASDLPTDTRAFPEPYPYPEPKDSLGVLAEQPDLLPRPQGAVAPRPTRGSRIRADWRPSQADLAYAAEQGFSLSETERIGENFRDYWVAVSGQKAMKLDWPATWRTWVRNQRDRAPVNGSGSARRQTFC